MSYRNLYADEVEAFLMQPGAVALDMRDYESYFAGHLQGAEHADEQTIRKLIHRCKQRPPVLVYCYHGTSNRDFAQLVHNLGFDQVHHLEGGYNSWSQLAAT